MNTYYQENREKILQRQKEKYHKNPRVYIERVKESRNSLVLEKKNLYRLKKKEYQKEYYAKWYKKNGRNRADNYTECILEWHEANPEKIKIHQQLRQAVLKGKVIRPKECSRCGKEGRIHAHHINYEHFMNFVWLCASCHKLEHGGKNDK